MRLAGLPLLQAEIVMMELCKAIVRIPAPAVTMETILSEGSTSFCRKAMRRRKCGKTCARRGE